MTLTFDPSRRSLRALPGQELGFELWASGQPDSTLVVEYPPQRGLHGEAFVVEDTPKPGDGFFQERLKPVPEKLLKCDQDAIEDGYLRKGWRYYYQPPDLRLAGPAVTRLGRLPKRLWLSLRVPPDQPAGVYQTQLVARASGREFCLPIEVEVLGVRPVEPAQDRMLWLRATLDPRRSQHYVDEAELRWQLRDIRTAGFTSFSLRERSQRLAQKVLDLASECGFCGRAVLLQPFPRWLAKLDFHAMQPVLYVSDEVDAGGNTWEVHHRNLTLARRLYPHWPTMASAVSWQTFSGGGPDIVSLCLDGGAAPMEMLEAFPQLRPQNTYFYWQTYPEQAMTHRVLAGFGLYKSGASGISPYCYQHRPRYPGSPYNDFEAFERGWSRRRQHMTTYPARRGSVSTLQWEGLKAGLWDLCLLATRDHYLGPRPGYPQGLDLKAIQPDRPPEQLGPGQLDQWREELFDELQVAIS
ncbi:MAG: hypothetical protein AB7S38_25130 [Vulcanimicrobiota bacterium]